MQTLDLFGAVPERLHRRSDPQTSAQAAGKVEDYRAHHEGKIYGALTEAGAHGATAQQMAEVIDGMDSVQISRRLASMERRGLIERRYRGDGKHVQRGGFCCWWAK
jgi:DNA-binding MarR family transcriptional regulator